MADMKEMMRSLTTFWLVINMCVSTAKPEDPKNDEHELKKNNILNLWRLFKAAGAFYRQNHDLFSIRVRIIPSWPLSQLVFISFLEAWTFINILVLHMIVGLAQVQFQGAANASAASWHSHTYLKHSSFIWRFSWANSSGSFCQGIWESSTQFGAGE